jgi:hypothetical protein
VLAALLALYSAAGAAAQSNWTEQHYKSGVGLEILKPSFESGEGLTFLTTTSYLSGRFALSENTMIEAELPISHVGVSSDYGGGSETALGNPYVGILTSGSSTFVGRFGVRIPVASSEDYSALAVGILSDFDRFEAFTTDVVTGTASFGTRHRPSENFEFEWGAGPVLLVSTEDIDERVELFAQYRAQAMYIARSFSFGAGFSGRGLITEGDLDFGQRTIHQLTVMGTANLSGFHPGLYMRIPVDDDLSGLNFTLGLHLTIDLGRPR